MIPKLAHYVWFGPAPEWVNQVATDFSALHPDWIVKIHDRMPTRMPRSIRRRALACHQFCQLADILVAWLLYEQGGVALDTDTIAVKRFDALLGLDAFTSAHSDHDRRLTNACMGSAPGSEAFRACIDYIEKSEPIVKHGQVRRCYYGPDMFTELFAGRSPRPGMTVLPWHYFYPYMYDERAKAHQCWKATPDARRTLLNEMRARYVDGVSPYAIHLWGVEGSSHREVGDVAQYMGPLDAGPESVGDPGTAEGQAPDLPVADRPRARPLAGGLDPRGGNRSQARRAGESAARNGQRPPAVPG